MRTEASVWENRWSFHHKDTWDGKAEGQWKTRKLCPRPQSFLKQAYRILLEVSYHRVLQTQIGNWGDAWNEIVVIWQKCSHAWWRVGRAKVTTWEQLEESRITDCGHPELRLYRSRLQSYRSEKSKRIIISRSSILRK